MEIKELSEAIKAARKAAGLTQKTAAEKLGVTREFYAKYEIGKENPTLTTLNKLAEAFNCDFKATFEPRQPL